MTPRRAIARAPRATVTLTMAGSNSGDRPTANATAKSSESIQGRPSHWLTTTTNSTITIITRSSNSPKRRTPRANSVSGSRCAMRSATAPNSVARPVAVTSTVAVPLRTEVPRKTMLSRRASGVAAAQTPARFSTGIDSPVSAASLTRKSRACSSTASAGTRLPAARCTMSPTTTLATGTRCSLPPRCTRALSATRWRSCATANEARHSCAKPSKALPITITPMIAASIQSRSTSDTAAPNNRINTSGLTNWRSSSRGQAGRLSAARASWPGTCWRREASRGERPESLVCSATFRAVASRRHGAVGGVNPWA